MGVAGVRSRSNIAAGAKGGLGGLAAFAFYYLNEVIKWDLTAISDPGNLQILITWGAAFFGLTGSIAGWNRDQQSYKPPTFVPETVSDWTPVNIPVKKNWFSRAELECKGRSCNCHFPGMDPEVMDIANDLRERFGPIYINSAFRCPEHNAEVNGSRNSFHMKAKALDLRAKNASPTEIYEYLIAKYVGSYGFARYKHFVHIDTRRLSWARRPEPGEPWKSYENAIDVS